MRKLKIAQVANIWQSIPPNGYGGTEKIIYQLCEGLSKKGHDVSLFATGDSKTKSQLHYSIKKRLIGNNISWNNYLFSLSHFLQSYDLIMRKGNFDIIHGHYSLASDLISLSLANFQKTPSIFTLHYTVPTHKQYSDRKIIFDYLKDMNFVSISNNQRQKPLHYVATVYHGLDIDKTPFTSEPKGNSIFWLGRIVPEKGLDYALEVAKRLNKNIVVAGRIDKESKKNFEYYNNKIKDELKSPRVKFYENSNTKQNNNLFLDNKCFIFPIKWQEPFGLVLIESMACGMPVVAFASGSVPEIIKDGVTGFLVNFDEKHKTGNWIIKKTGIEGLCEAMKKIYALNYEQYQVMRYTCRAHIKENFTTKIMIEKYEKIYRTIVNLKNR